MTEGDPSGRSRAPLVVIVIAVLSVAAVIGLVALVGAPLFRGADATVAPAAGGIVLTYQVRPVDGVDPQPVVVEAVAGVMIQRLQDTGAEFRVRTGEAGRVTVEVAVPIGEAAAIDALLAPTGEVSFIPLGQDAIEAGQAVDPAIQPIVTDVQVVDATVDTDQTGGQALTLALDGDARAAFAAWSRAHVGDYLAIALDGRAIAVPVLMEAIEDGRIQIAGGGIGGLSPEEVPRLASIIRHDPLPAPVVRVGAAP